jgi:transposase
MEIRASRRVWTRQEKRQIVEATLKPDASVSVIARAHDVNANQVFRWRKLYREGHLEAEVTANKLLPVKITDVGIQKIRAVPRDKSKANKSGVIDIDLGHARVRIEGAADPDCVRAVLSGLLQ